ncbi:MAG: bifunctional 5,10-methylenetetrahydrofolate dehydrogenase/5,10-methenyltetrahydrofolate cyclohydrolase [Terriglobales bacterium]|jgi:methylenetetrahydrofolate dehydrogenase (NADP+)/methenyltetrahydrofolate cyclohydrolase
MTAEIMYGAPVAEQIESRVRAGAQALRRTSQVVPRLDVVQVGRSPASTRYVKKKLEACERLGMRAELHLFGEEVTGAELRDQVRALSADTAVHGILVQLPLPDSIENPPDTSGVDKFAIFDAIAPHKDIDGVSRFSVPELYRAQQHVMLFLPCTPLAVLRMLAFYQIPTKGKVAVVVGRNDITAKPMHHLLGGRMCNATAIWCHRYTQKRDHDEFMRQADIIVTSVGNPNYRITAELVKPGAVVIDIGTRVDADGRLQGDVDFASVRQVAAWVTPVPKGVGPVTVAALTENLLRAAEFAAGTRNPGYEL